MPECLQIPPQGSRNSKQKSRSPQTAVRRPLEQRHQYNLISSQHEDQRSSAVGGSKIYKFEFRVSAQLWGGCPSLDRGPQGKVPGEEAGDRAWEARGQGPDREDWHSVGQGRCAGQEYQSKERGSKVRRDLHVEGNSCFEANSGSSNLTSGDQNLCGVKVKASSVRPLAGSSKGSWQRMLGLENQIWKIAKRPRPRAHLPPQQLPRKINRRLGKPR